MAGDDAACWRGTAVAGPAAEEERPRLRPVLSAVLLALAMAALASSIVGPALPTVAGDLGGWDFLPWVASASLLTLTVSIPLWAALSDRYGRKRPFQVATVLFVIGALLSGLAPTMATLIASRALQGLGAGGLMGLAQVLLADVLAPGERGRYNGLIGAAVLAPMVGGPVVGGALVALGTAGWRWCFLINVPAGLIVLAINQRHLPNNRGAATGTPFDWRGAVCVTGAATTGMLLLSMAGARFAWASAWSYLLGGLALVLSVLTVRTQRRATSPILPPWMFSRRTIAASIAASAMVGGVMYGAVIYLPQYLQLVIHLGPTASGLMMLPLMCGLIAAQTASGLLVSRSGRWKPYPVVGMALLVGSLAWLSQMATRPNVVLVGLGIGLVGCALGLGMQLLILGAQNEAPDAEVAAVTSTVTFSRSLGGALGVSVFGVVFAQRLRQELTSATGVHLPAEVAAGLDVGTPESVRSLPAEVSEVISTSFAAAMQSLFLATAIAATAALIAVLAMRATTLRSREPATTPANDASHRAIT